MSSVNLWGEDIIEEEIVEEKETSLSFFDIIKSLQKGTDFRAQDKTLTAYNSFMVNRALGENQALLPFANILNRLPHLTDEVQYLFLKTAVPPWSGYTKWAKKDKDKLLDDLIDIGYIPKDAKETILLYPKDIIQKHIKEVKKEMRNARNK